MFEQQLGRSVTIDQAAALLQVSRRTIYNRIREGRLLTIRTIGGSQRVLLSSLDENRKPTWVDPSEPFAIRRHSQTEP
jgi:excisionase family DNA binding protein